MTFTAIVPARLASTRLPDKPLADIAGNVRKGRPAHEVSPVALEAVKRIDALFDIEHGLGGLTAGRIGPVSMHAHGGAIDHEVFVGKRSRRVPP